MSLQESLCDTCLCADVCKHLEHDEGNPPDEDGRGASKIVFLRRIVHCRYHLTQDEIMKALEKKAAMYRKESEEYRRAAREAQEKCRRIERDFNQMQQAIDNLKKATKEQ